MGAICELLPRGREDGAVSPRASVYCRDLALHHSLTTHRIHLKGKSECSRSASRLSWERRRYLLHPTGDDPDSLGLERVLCEVRLREEGLSSQPGEEMASGRSSSSPPPLTAALPRKQALHSGGRTRGSGHY